MSLGEERDNPMHAAARPVIDLFEDESSGKMLVPLMPSLLQTMSLMKMST